MRPEGGVRKFGHLRTRGGGGQKLTKICGRPKFMAANTTNAKFYVLQYISRHLLQVSDEMLTKDIYIYNY